MSRIYGADFATRTSQPVVGITGNYDDGTCMLKSGYYQQIVKAGATPFIIPPTTDHDVLLSVLDHIDALLLSGGDDVNPLYAGEEPSPLLSSINAERDEPELLLARLAFNRQMPILGICRGMQVMAVALGGRVAQDLSLLPQPLGRHEPHVKHSQQAGRSEATHTVTLDPDSTLLYNIYRNYRSVPVGLVGATLSLHVNSFHHQAVSEPGPHFIVAARAADGVVEAIESAELKPFVGVQWHPECMDDDGQALFSWLASEAATYREVQQLHDRMLTLDTHCDTPMKFFSGITQRFDFNRRDSQALVNLPKMVEGRLDASIMVAYLPQPVNGKSFARMLADQLDVPAIEVDGPKAYADTIFDRIHQIVDNNRQALSLARTPDELWANKQAGRKSIMLGIENGLALEGDIANVGYFKSRGVVYITLCHNGDNDICDSARGSQTYGGVSEFGAKVIKEMNRLGVMVDLSHAAESSFYDALNISTTPIVCSHSSARALCDHPRNLTDEQMRALAQKGGVCQITLYNGFLVNDGQATILDAMRHLDHAIQVMGIDHVGLGTDFDGDGGVPGLADASELTLFTRQLLARRYSETDIQKIWGGNFLRVMREVQGVCV